MSPEQEMIERIKACEREIYLQALMLESTQSRLQASQAECVVLRMRINRALGVIGEKFLRDILEGRVK